MAGIPVCAGWSVSPVGVRESPRGGSDALDLQAQKGFSRGRSGRVAFVVSEANDVEREEVMPSLKKHEIESRPRSREKGSTRSRENRREDMVLYLSCNFPKRTEGRAPETLHVGRRPIALAQPEVDDPGSKGERVAWKTAPSTGRMRQRTDAVRHCVDLPSRGDGWRAMCPMPVAVAQPVERPPETRGAAGSIPAGHIFVGRDSDASRPLEGLPPARYPVSKTGGPRGLGGSTPSPPVSAP